MGQRLKTLKLNENWEKICFGQPRVNHMETSRWLGGVSCVCTEPGAWRLAAEGALSRTVKADALVHVLFGLSDLYDDCIYNPSLARSTIILLCTFSPHGTATFAALRNVSPFPPLQIAPQAVFKVPKGDRWDQVTLVCGGRETSVIVAANTIFWFTWTLQGAMSVKYHVKELSCSVAPDSDIVATAVCLARRNLACIGFSDASVRLVSTKPGQAECVFRLNSSFPVQSVTRVGSDAVLVAVSESEGIRLWVLHCESRAVVELQPCLSVSAFHVEPCSAIQSSSPAMYASAHSSATVALSSNIAVYYCSLRPALDLLQLHFWDSSADPTTPPLLQAPMSVLRVAIFDSPIRSLLFLRPAVLQVRLTNDTIETVEF